MTLHDYWDLLRRSWLLILGTTVAGGAAALGLSLITTPVYQAQSQLFVSVQSPVDFSGAYTGVLYVQQRIKSYVTLVDTPDVLDPVIDDLDIDPSSPDLGGISAVNPTNTVLLNVQATSIDPETAATVADAVATSLAAEIVELETTEAGTKPVKAKLVRPAKVPKTPISPRTQLNLVLGALLGLMVGVGIAVLRRAFDTSIKSSADLEDATEAPALGVVIYDPDAQTHPLVTLRDSARAEAFRTIRTNLRYVDVDHPPHSVVITSSLPGVGKTTTACNLAIALGQAGLKVLLVEADMRRPRVAEYLGVERTIGLTDVLIGQATSSDAIVNWKRGLLDFLPAGAIPPNPSELLGSHQMTGLLEELSDRYDTIILDTPPLLPVSDAAILATVSDGALLIAHYGHTTREQAQHAADALRQVGARVLGSVLNFAPVKRRGAYRHGYGYGYGYGYGASPGDSAGTRPVPEDDEVPAAEPRT